MSKLGKVNIDERVLLIRINQTYFENMSDYDLYNATRGIWKIGERRYSADYAFAIYKGLIKEVYKIYNWEPATRYCERLLHWDSDIEGRWQFNGKVDEDMHTKYIGKDISDYFKNGNANPVCYINA